MKHVKMLGLVAVAALALMAVLGAGTASATRICKTNTNTTTCPAGEHIVSGATVDASLTKGSTAILETLEGTVLDTCTEGTVKGTTEQTGSSTETVSILAPTSGITWGGCTKTTDTTAGGTIEIHWISGTDNATLTIKDAQVTINTIFGTCTYGYGSTYKHLGTFEGGKPASMTINTIVPKITGNFACPSESRWTASYTMTEPNGGTLYATSG